MPIFETSNPGTSSRLRTLMNYAFAGAAASIVLALIECVDMNIQLTPVFKGPVERLILASYLGVNVLVGAVLGIVIGLFTITAEGLAGGLANILARSPHPG